MRLHNIRSEATGYTTWGCIWKKGECPVADGKLLKRIVCRNEKGVEVAMQSRITSSPPGARHRTDSPSELPEEPKLPTFLFQTSGLQKK